MIENELFDQNWRTRRKADQVRYVVLKWTFCFAIGILTGVVGFVVNLAVENVAGLKHQAVSALMDSSRCDACDAGADPFVFLSLSSYQTQNQKRRSIHCRATNAWSMTLSLLLST